MDVFGALLVTMLLFVTFHTYDLIFVALLVPLVHGEGLVLRLAMTAGVLACLRMNNATLLLGLSLPGEQYFIGSFLATAAILWLAGTAWAVLARKEQKQLM